MIRSIEIKDGLKLSENAEPEFKSYKELGFEEKDLEELLRKNIDLLLEEETLLIVGQQLVNDENGKADLIAIDTDGDLVLIELKRDSEDAKNRREKFEFQAIRYAASLATIETPEDLVKLSFAKYIEKHSDEFDLSETDAFEAGLKIVNEFLYANISETKAFNEKQRIILGASSFELQTLSAASWLSNNGIDISCYSISILEIGEKHFLETQKVLPTRTPESFLVDIKRSSSVNNKIREKSSSRKNLPRMNKLMEWGIIKPGDHVSIKNKEGSTAKIINSSEVEYNEKKMSFNSWGQMVTGWSSICIYEWAILNDTGKTLDHFRREKMGQEEIEAA